MSEIIDAVIVVDTEGLNRAYPNGIPQHTIGGTEIEQFFRVLVDREHAYQDPESDLAGTTGIQCNVNDMIYFRSIAKADTANDVIILEFADKSEGVATSNLTDYLSIPSFRTSRKTGFAYDNNRQAVPYQVWNGWKMWYAITETAQRVDPHMSVQALQSTEALQHKHIRYTLGLRVSFPGTVRDYWFDPAIKITG
jgi:hypothetical protein